MADQTQDNDLLSRVSTVAQGGNSTSAPTQSDDLMRRVSTSAQQSTGEERTVKMEGWTSFDIAHPFTKGQHVVKDVPVSQIEEANKQGFAMVVSPEKAAAQRKAAEADSIKDDPIGNAIITGGAGLVKGGIEAGASALMDTGAGQAVKDTAQLAGEYGEYGVEAAKDMAKSAFQSVSKMAAEHPQAARHIVQALLGGTAGGLHGGVRDAVIGALMGSLIPGGGGGK